MADLTVIEGDPLDLNLYLVSAAGVPITEQSVTLKLVKIIDGDYEFFTGEGWSDTTSTVDYIESDEVPGLYRYTVLAADMGVGHYIAITTAPNKGALAENVTVIPRKQSRRVVVI